MASPTRRSALCWKNVPASDDALLVRLRDAGIQPSAQRVAVARYVLDTCDHPSADDVWQRVRRTLPALSRATVYNTLNLLVRQGLLRAHVLAPRRVVFDPNLERHHHFIDDRTGRIHDVPYAAVTVGPVGPLPGLDVRACEVVLRGRASPRAARPRG